MSKHLLLTVGTDDGNKQRLVNMDYVRVARKSAGKTNLTFNDDSFMVVNESLMQIHSMLKERNK